MGTVHRFELCQWEEGSCPWEESFDPYGHHGNFTPGVGKTGKTIRKTKENQEAHSVHGPRKCPAWDKNCHRCNEIGHFDKVCRTPKKPRVETITKYVEVIRVVNPKPAGTITKETVAEPPPPSETPTVVNKSCPYSSDELTLSSMIQDSFDIDDKELAMEIDMLEASESSSLQDIREYADTLQLKGKHYVNFKPDPGSQVNLIPYDTFCKLNSEGEFTLKPSNLVTRAEGSFTASTKTKYGASMILEYDVAKKVRRPLLGIYACHHLNLVRLVEHPTVASLVTKEALVGETKENFINKNRDVFEGRRQFTQMIHLEIDNNIPSGMRYSYSIAERLKVKLQSLVDSGVIDKVKGSMPKFISNLVIREKPSGDLRLCLDPQILNKALRAKMLLSMIR
ncbi:ATP-dependent RNA helicase glh-4 [Frankliniella fusca]|uniref:ATP-dependent RNA helicase glh-4 n=1 Tax=Frankliniella fusca TaxID=407009 RepID=A0AAE1LMK0_9NEOP|nr:ATP-dependent RNA helicase glh-4 [Frankliniella fusca]